MQVFELTCLIVMAICVYVTTENDKKNVCKGIWFCFALSLCGVYVGDDKLPNRRNRAAVSQ